MACAGAFSAWEQVRASHSVGLGNTRRLAGHECGRAQVCPCPSSHASRCCGLCRKHMEGLNGCRIPQGVSSLAQAGVWAAIAGGACRRQGQQCFEHRFSTPLLSYKPATTLAADAGNSFSAGCFCSSGQWGSGKHCTAALLGDAARAASAAWQQPNPDPDGMQDAHNVAPLNNTIMAQEEWAACRSAPTMGCPQHCAAP